MNTESTRAPAGAGPASAGEPGRRTSVLVVMPTLNEARSIESVLAALVQDLPPRADIRWVVVDGGSTDGTVERVLAAAARRPDLLLLRNPRRLQSAAVNLAVTRLGRDADVLIRCDAHAHYPPGYCRRLLETLQATGADAVVVAMDSTGESCLQRAVAWVSDTPVGSGGSAHRGGRTSGYVDHGHHAAFRIDSFRRAGGYDESFSHNEDAELDCRQARLGARIYLDADIRLQYRPRAALGGLWRQYFGYGRGRSRTARRHAGSIRLRQLLVPLHAAVSATALVLAWWFPALLLWPAAYAAALGAVSIGLAVRHRSRCALLAGVAAAVMHTAWAAGFCWGLLTLRERRWSSHTCVPLQHVPQAGAAE